MIRLIPYLIILVFLNIPIYAQHSMEFQLGSVMDKRVFFSEAPFPINPTFSTASVGYLYSFNEYFSLGGWIGVMRNLPPPIIGGIKLVFFDKSELALALNIGIFPTIGIYFKNFYLNGMLGFIEESRSYNFTTGELTTGSNYIPYLELGYSWNL